jgi:hypothetical protein
MGDHAEVAELADAQDSKSCPRKGVRVRFPPSALAGPHGGRGGRQRGSHRMDPALSLRDVQPLRGGCREETRTRGLGCHAQSAVKRHSSRLRALWAWLANHGTWPVPPNPPVSWEQRSGEAISVRRVGEDCFAPPAMTRSGSFCEKPQGFSLFALLSRMPQHETVFPGCGNWHPAKWGNRIFRSARRPDLRLSAFHWEQGGTKMRPYELSRRDMIHQVGFSAGTMLAAVTAAGQKKETPKSQARARSRSRRRRT